MGGDHSNWVSVDSEIPQGTVLGPLLFLAHFNDLPEDLQCFILCVCSQMILLYTRQSMCPGYQTTPKRSGVSPYLGETLADEV